MRNFDEQRNGRDRDFQIGGEKFTMKPVRPESLLKHQELNDKPEEMLPQMDDLILGLIENTDDGHKRFKKLRARENDPLTLGDIQTLMQWLIGQQSAELEETTGRPTEPHSSSIPGPVRIGAPLTDVSSSPAAPAQTA